MAPEVQEGPEWLQRHRKDKNGCDKAEMGSRGGGPDCAGTDTPETCHLPCCVAGECSCHEGYAPDPVHRHLCVRSDWGHSEG